MDLLVVVIPAVIVAAGGWFVAARQFSGKIASSDATELWKESASIRSWQTEMVKDYRDRAEKLEAEIRKCTDRNAELQEIIRQQGELIAQLHDKLEGPK